MGYKFDLKKGHWNAYFSKRHPVTRQPVTLRREGLKSEAEAVRAEKRLIAEVQSRISSTVHPRWEAVISAYLAFTKETGVTMNYLDDSASLLKAHTLPAWGKRQVNTITTQEIRDLLKTTVGERSASHQKNVLNLIRGVFNFALERGHVLRNPTPQLKFRVGDKLKAVLTEVQARELLAKSRDLDWEWYPHWAMALYTGMRNGELYALTWDKVNLEDRLIKVDTAWNNVDGFKSTKSGDDRILEIAPPLLQVLKQLKLQQADTRFVLPRIDRWDKGEQARELRMFLQGIGLPPIRFHDLRATWATILLTKGVEPIKVMKMGGWRDLKTMQIYVRKAGVDIKGASDCLNLHDPAPKTGQVLEFKSV